MATLLDGRAVAATLRTEVAEDVAAFTERYGRAPGLTAILVGDDAPSKVYLRRIAQSCAYISSMFCEVVGSRACICSWVTSADRTCSRMIWICPL